MMEHDSTFMEDYISFPSIEPKVPSLDDDNDDGDDDEDDKMLSSSPGNNNICKKLFTMLDIANMSFKSQ
ncbi:hypothetical protein H4219_002671 [Mycoemilia scoparia]|uniref:Uncharacterized protein n=1 Tax=Mycoemilia scoparia TaxID=417184 RepID=A0A9W7ZWW1_9FUNG|nr:hypothetical protein H4219_002671 [Mycoemilia scoparia]